MRRSAFWASVALTIAPILVLAGVERLLAAPAREEPSRFAPPDDPLAQYYRGELDGQRVGFTFTSGGGVWLSLDARMRYSGSVAQARATLTDGVTTFEATIGVDEGSTLNVTFLGGPFDQRSLRIHPESTPPLAR
ncbi:MAG: hypothetical protein ACYDA1_01620 [Vulcanimicrobiaceae bacterium]